MSSTRLADPVRAPSTGIDQWYPAQLLSTIPGLGDYSSLAIACRIGSIERFAKPGGLANFWGLTPRCRNSGETKQRLGSITKEGSTIVRFLLGQTVYHVLRKCPRWRAWYKQLKARRGSKIARVAVMRRLATAIWYVVKHDLPFDPPAKLVAWGQPEVKPVASHAAVAPASAA